MSLHPFVAVFALAPLAGAQVRETWAQRHDGPANQSDFANAIAIDVFGNVDVTGRSFNATMGFPPAPPTQDIETVQYSSSGVEIWSARYNSPLNSDDIGNAIAVSNSGRVYVGGQSSGYNGTLYVTLQTVIAYESNGTLAWANQYGSASVVNVVRSIVVDGNGAIFVGGTNGMFSSDMSVKKLDALGNVVWEATYDGTAHGNDYVYQIALASNGDILAGGYVASSVSGTNDLALVRVSASGSVLWARELDGGASLSDQAFSIAVDGAGNAYAAGFATTAAQGQNTLLAAYDAAGTFLWSRTFDGSAHGNDVLRKVTVDPSGRVIALGGASNTGTGTDFVLFAYDSAGTLAWQRTWDSPAHLDDTARALVVEPTGNIDVAGYRVAATTPTSDSDAVVIQYDADGAERFVHIHDGGGANSQRAVDLALGPNASFYAAGDADSGTNNSTDYLTFRLDRTAVTFCLGDGSGTACPCGNASLTVQQAGCAHSLGAAGRLIDAGSSSLANDTLVLQGSQMPNAPALYFQGTAQQSGGAGAVFGDGLRCVAGSVVRLGTKTNIGGISQYPAAGDASVSVRGSVGAPGTRTYQIWYRNAAAFCTLSTFNLTNGLLVTWTP